MDDDEKLLIDVNESGWAYQLIDYDKSVSGKFRKAVVRLRRLA